MVDPAAAPAGEGPLSVVEVRQALSDWKPALVSWFPHSGGRWLNRGLLGRHPQLDSVELFSPLLLAGLDDLLHLDRTFQVHKSRTQLARAQEFLAVREALEDTMSYGIGRYLVSIHQRFAKSDRPFFGVVPVGAEAMSPHHGLIRQWMPEFRVIHLVRHPLDCFASLKSRSEMEGCPVRAGTAWLRFNRDLRTQSGLGAYTRIRFEDLLRNAMEACGQLLDVLGLQWHPDMQVGLQEYHGRNQGVDLRPTVSSQERATLREICHQEALHYGYEWE